MSKKSNNGTGFAIGAIIGGVVGSVAALLLAPKSGKELRADINVKKDELVEKSGEYREKGAEWISVAKEKGSVIKDNVVTKGQELKETVTTKGQEISQGLKVRFSKDTNESDEFAGEEVLNDFSDELDEQVAEIKKKSRKVKEAVSKE